MATAKAQREFAVSSLDSSDARQSGVEVYYFPRRSLSEDPSRALVSARADARSVDSDFGQRSGICAGHARDCLARRRRGPALPPSAAPRPERDSEFSFNFESVS